MLSYKRIRSAVDKEVTFLLFYFRALSVNRCSILLKMMIKSLSYSRIQLLGMDGHAQENGKEYERKTPHFVKVLLLQEQRVMCRHHA